MVAQVHCLLDLLLAQPLGDPLVPEQLLAERAGTAGRPSGRRLDQPVCLLAIGPLGDHGQQQGLGEDHPVEQLQVAGHPIGVDLEPVKNRRQGAGGVGGDPQRALEDETLG